MAKKGAKKPAKLTRVSPLKPDLRGASRLVQSRIHAGLRSATLSNRSMLRFASSALLVILALAFVALWLGGYLPTVRQSVTDFKQDRLMAMGFTVERIDVTGEGRLNENDVRAAVGIYEGDYFFGADLKRAQRNTESLPWVDRAVVRRLWPNRIVVQLVEIEPYALYQTDGTVYLTAHDGRIIAPLSTANESVASSLRLFTGVDAASHAISITQILQQFPAIWDATQSLTRHASGRWDLHLAEGMVLRLPVGDEAEALQRFNSVKARLGTDYGVIDLRLGDRLTLTAKTASEA